MRPNPISGPISGQVLIILILFNLLFITPFALNHSFAQESNIDLSDILIAYSSKFSGCESVITFDKKASKHQLFELIK